MKYEKAVAERIEFDSSDILSSIDISIGACVDNNGGSIFKFCEGRHVFMNSDME